MQCQLKDIDVYYEVYGEGRPLIAIHGFMPDHHLMTGCMEPVFKHREGWQRIYPDLPGMGQTPGPEWMTNSDQMLDVVMEFIEQVIPGQRFTLAGESYGGYLARGIIHRQPELVDGLLLICPLIVPLPDDRTLPSHVVLARDDALWSSLEPGIREEFASFTVVQTQQIWERTKDEVMVGLNAADRDFLSTLQQAHNYPLSFDVDTLATSFEKPTLILTGRQDSMVGYWDAWQIYENYPRATFVVLDRAGHNLQIEQETLFNALVNEWLNRMEECRK
jgi:pimeloyl-ACP methyl ester carboxylesterase